jgi:hypothetical protein
MSVTITVSITPSTGAATVYLFYHIKNMVSGETSPWNNGVTMKAGASGEYSRAISSTEVPNLEVIYNTGDSGAFLYQFVVIDAAGAVLARSPVYSDVTLSPCH